MIFKTWSYPLFSAILFLALPLVCMGEKKQEDYKQLAKTLDEMHLTVDTTYVKNYKKMNEYSTIGVQYGVALSTPSFQPTRNTKMVFIPVNVGVMYTHYCKMFGYMPYFGVQVGIFYTQDAYQFETSSTGYTDSIFGAYKATLQVLELPALAYFHYDFWKMRILANVGIFGGYRLSIHREYKEGVVDRSLENTFAPVENRWDYGIKAGGGFAFIFDPIEIHITASYKYSWSNLYQPNYLSKYYYKWAYPTNIVIGVGVHYQLTRRAGTTTKELKRQAREEAEMMMAVLREQRHRDSLSTMAATPRDTTIHVPTDSSATNAHSDTAIFKPVKLAPIHKSVTVPENPANTASDSGIMKEKSIIESLKNDENHSGESR